MLDNSLIIINFYFCKMIKFNFCTLDHNYIEGAQKITIIFVYFIFAKHKINTHYSCLYFSSYHVMLLNYHNYQDQDAIYNHKVNSVLCRRRQNALLVTCDFSFTFIELAL